MALPAGRYGVTKNQLLKIKKLPMNTMRMITETKEGIAIIEDGAKASQLITAGRQFWHNGKLYSADENIAKDADIITSGEGKNATKMPNITDQLPGTDAEKANEITIARVENGSTPTATINAGEQFYHNGVLYTATQDIATTDTITPNTNCRVSDSVTGQIRAIKDYVDGVEKIITTELKQKADNSVIGTVEGANASKAWSVGEHFISGGQFKEVTQPIASGGAINDSNTVDRPIADCLVRLLPIFNNAGSHNGIFRGKNLGSSLTTAQKTAIANGSFEDLYIGDYWEINGIKWRIAHFDYWYRSGDTQCTTHHVVVVPDNVLNYKIMNDKVDNKDVTTGAYINSKMYQSQIADARNIVKTAFGENNILTHREWFANDTNVGGWETGGAWYDSQIDLMNEIMVYGSNIFHNCVNGTSLPGGNYTIDKVQLALFRLDQSYTIALNPAGTDRTYWWLRDVCNATNFAFVGRYGNANDYGASSSYGVRPAFAIK